MNQSVVICSRQKKAKRSRVHAYAAGYGRQELCLKPRPHQQQRRSNIIECYKSNDSFDRVECCFDIVADVDVAWTVARSRWLAVWLIMSLSDPGHFDCVVCHGHNEN